LALLAPAEALLALTWDDAAAELATLDAGAVDVEVTGALAGAWLDDDVVTTGAVAWPPQAATSVTAVDDASKLTVDVRKWRRVSDAIDSRLLYATTLPVDTRRRR